MGAYIYLPPKPASEVERPPPPSDPNKELAEIVREDENYWAVRILPNVPYTLPTSDVVPVPRKGAFVSFFHNGQCLGVAFQDIVGGTYYPAVSVYHGAFTANFGPTFFQFKPPGHYPKDFRPASEL